MCTWLVYKYITVWCTMHTTLNWYESDLPKWRFVRAIERRQWNVCWASIRRTQNIVVSAKHHWYVLEFWNRHWVYNTRHNVWKANCFHLLSKRCVVLRWHIPAGVKKSQVCVLNQSHTTPILSVLFSSFCLLKVKVKVKFTLEQATEAQRGSRCIALLFLQPRR